MESIGGGLRVPIVNPIRVHTWVGKLRRKVYELVKVTESILLSFNFRGVVSIIEKLVFSLPIKEIASVLAKLNVILQVFENIVLRTLARFWVRLKSSISIYEKIVLNYIFDEAESILTKFKLKISCFESILLHLPIEIFLRFKSLVSILEGIVLDYICCEMVVNIISQLGLTSRLIEALSLNIKSKFILSMKKNIAAIEGIVFSLPFHEYLAINRLLHFNVHVLEILKTKEFLSSSFKPRQSVEMFDRISQFSIRLREHGSISGLLKFYFSKLLENIEVMEKTQDYLKLTQSTSLSEYLYYEVYPYEYSLDIVSGYPSKTFPSLDIKNPEVKTFGEVTVS